MNRLLCFLFGHKYFIIKRFSPVARKVGCDRCLKEWAMQDTYQAFLEWDGDFDELYST